MNPNFEALLEWQIKLADLIVLTQKEIERLQEKEQILWNKCRSTLAHFYLGLNDEHQNVEKELVFVQEQLLIKQKQLYGLQRELEEKIEAIIACYRGMKSQKIKV